MPNKKDAGPEVTASQEPTETVESPAPEQKLTTSADKLTTSDLKEAAQELDIPGRTRMSKEELAQAIIDTVQPAVAVPDAADPSAVLPPQPEPGTLPSR